MSKERDKRAERFTTRKVAMKILCDLYGVHYDDLINVTVNADGTAKFDVVARDADGKRFRPDVVKTLEVSD